MAKTLKTLGFIVDGRSKYGKFIFKVTIKKYDNYRRFRVRATPKGEKRIDKEFSDEWECRGWINDWKSKNEPSMEGWRDTQTMLNPEELNDAQVAVKLLPKGVTLCEAVSQFKLRNETKEIRVDEAWKEYRKLMVKTEGNRDGKWRSPKTVIEKDHFFKPIIFKIGERRIKDLEEEDLPEFWNNKKWGDQSRLNRFKAMKAFFSWCKMKRYHFQDIMRLQQTPKIERETLPQVLSLNEVEKLLEVSSKPRFSKLKSFVALSLFAGLRAGEIHNGWDHKTCLKWKDFTLEPEGKQKPFVSLPFVGKKKSTDNRNLSPNLVKILLEEKKKGMDVVPKKNGVNLWKKLRKECELTNLQANALRHTAISFFYRNNPFTNEETLDPLVMDYQFGNTEDVRSRHYKNVAKMTIAEARKFWSIKM